MISWPGEHPKLQTKAGCLAVDSVGLILARLFLNAEFVKMLSSPQHCLTTV